MLSTLDTVLTWIERIERTEWGRRVIALVVTAALSLWTWLTTSVEPPIIFFGALICVAASLYLQDRLVVWLDSRLGPPITVEINGVGADIRGYEDALKSEAFKTLQERFGYALEPMLKVTAPIVIVNRSRRHRVVLQFGSYNITPKDPRYLGLTVMGANGGVQLEGIQTGLGPEEHTEGRFSVLVSMAAYRQPNSQTLLIIDRVSGRKAVVPVPGRYPSKKSQK